MIFNLKNKTNFHFFRARTLIIMSALLGIFFINSFILSILAQKEQNDSKNTLLQVYQTLYSYKIENGSFPNTYGKSYTLNEVGELNAYVKSKNKIIKMDKIDLFIISKEEKFNIILQKKLVNGNNDVQILNSKKEFCHKKDGVKHEDKDCLSA